jgi:hypothetical protein
MTTTCRWLAALARTVTDAISAAIDTTSDTSEKLVDSRALIAPRSSPRTSDSDHPRETEWMNTAFTRSVTARERDFKR